MFHRHRFWIVLALITAIYLAFWAYMIVATATFAKPSAMWNVLVSREIQYATMLSVVTCTISALLSVAVAVPIGYLVSRKRFRGHSLVDAALDIPIVLPPMVVGICVLIFFQVSPAELPERIRVSAADVVTAPQPDGSGEARKPEPMLPDSVRLPVNDFWAWLSSMFTYKVAGVVLAQFVIAAAFAIRTMRGVFDHLSARPEDVALTLGASRWQALWHVTLPAARRGMFAAGSVAWARSLGEFGPILVFAGATRMRTEVLPTSVWLAWSVGDLEQGVAVSLLMIVISMLVLVAVKTTGERV
jgi:molybdate transport system permease protein